MDVTREDINGLGKRIAAVREDQIGCRAETETRLANVEKDVGTLEDAQTRIFTSVEQTNITLASLSGQIKTWGAVLIIASPVIAAIVSLIVGKYL